MHSRCSEWMEGMEFAAASRCRLHRINDLLWQACRGDGLLAGGCHRLFVGPEGLRRRVLLLPPPEFRPGTTSQTVTRRFEESKPNKKGELLRVCEQATAPIVE